MVNTMKLSKTIADWQYFIELEQINLVEGKFVINLANLSHISKQISRLKKELDQSFPEFGDLQETLANYNLYRQLESLQQQINRLSGVINHDCN